MDTLAASARRIRQAISLMLLIAAAGLLPSVALAHANLTRSTPAAESVSPISPPLVQVWFSEPLQISGSRLAVRDARGQRVDADDAGLDPGDDRSMRVTLRALSPGTYTVLWESASAADGHTLAGAFPFTVGDAPPATGYADLVREVDRAALAAQSPPPADLVSRWLVLTALVALTGAVLFSPLFMATPRLAAARERTSMRRRRWLIVLILFAAVAFGLEALARAGQGGLPALMAGRFGLTFGVRLGLLAGLLAVWRLGREAGWAGPLLGAALLLSQSANSHSAAEPTALPLLADWLHLAFTSLWLGGVAQIALIDAPLAARAADPGARADLGALIARFSPWAMLCVLGLALTGLAQSAAFVESIEALWSTAYGRALAAKLILFAVLLAFGAAHQFILAPRLRELRARSARAAEPSPGIRRAARLFSASAAAETLVGAMALLAAGMLISLPPSRDVAPNPTLATLIQTRAAGDLTVTLGMTPAAAGPNQFALRIDGPAGAPAEGAVLRIDHQTINTGLTEIVLSPYAEPVFVARSSAIALQGAWRIEAIVRRAGRPDTPVVFEANIPR